MQVKELVEQLNKLPQDLEVYLWINGNRLRADSVDDSFVEEGMVDINAEDNPHGDYK